MRLKKILSLLLAMTMLFSCIGITAMAEDNLMDLGDIQDLIDSGEENIEVQNNIFSGVSDEAGLKEALQAGGSITLGGNIEITEMIEIPVGVEVELDLAGYAITSGFQTDNTKHIYPFSNCGVLTITDSSTDKTGSISGRGIYNQNGAKITVNNAKIVSQDTNGGACIWGYGTDGEVYLNDATLIGYTGVVSSEGYVEINGGTYTCYSGIADDGTILSSPTYNIRAYNGLKITDGDFTSRHGVIYLGGGEAVIEDGTYTIEFKAATTSNVVFVYGDTDLTINGGEFISDDSADVADSGAAVLVDGDSVKLTINDGTYVGMNGMVSGNDNTVIKGGSFDTVFDYNHYGNIEEFVEIGAVITVAGETIIKNEDGTMSTAVTTFEELNAAIANGGKIVLANDITTTSAIVTSGVTAEIDLNGNTLKIGAGDNKFNDKSNITIKNGNINIDGVSVSGNAIFCLDEHEETLVTTLTLENVNLTGENYSSAYGVFYIGKSSVLNVNGGVWNLSNDLYSAGGVFKADASSATLNITGAEMTLNNVRRVVTYADTEIKDSTITISGDTDGVDAEMEHGFNRSPLVIDNSTITMTDMVGRGITAENGAVEIKNNSTVTITNAQEATIDVRNGQTVTVSDDSTVKVDKEPTITSGTINGSVATSPKSGTIIGYTSETTIWGETSSNARESYVIKVYSDDTFMGQSALNPDLFTMNGNVNVTWNIALDAASNTDEYWIMSWTVAPSLDLQPTHVAIEVDGVETSRGEVRLNSPDDLKPIYAAIADENGKITSYATSLVNAAAVAEAGDTVLLLRESSDTVEFVAGVTLDKNGFTAEGVTVAEPSLSGSGTEEDPYLINNLAELKWFRDKVNTYTSDGSNQYKGKYVKLNADIDLAGENWEPIGNNATNDHESFMGIFDGGGHTIKNLYVNSDGDHLGFFARIGSYAEGINPTVKNITFENVDVSSNTLTGHGGSYVGGVIANAGGNSIVENVKVKGNVYVTGYGYVGGIVGHGYPDLTDCSVIGNDGSWVHAHYWCAGGIIGYAGEGGTPITNCQVEGLDIWSAYGAAAAVAGLLQDGNTLTNVSAKDVEITSDSDYCMGVVAGNGEASTLINVTATNVTATAKGNEITYTDAVAKVNNTYYAALSGAVAAAENGEIITILKDGEYELPSFFDKELTFKGASKDGVIINDAPDARDQGWRGSSIHFENLTAKGATANYHGLANGVVTVTYKDCNVNNLRFLYATDTVSFENCTFKASGVEHSFWTYGASKVTVTGCTFEYTDRAVNCYSENGAEHETDISFSGCTFTYAGIAEAPEGAVEINSGTVKSIDVDFTNCTAPEKGAMWFNSQWDGKKGANTVVKVDDTQVWPISYVAQIGDTYYETFEDALNAVQDGETITLLDVTGSELSKEIDFTKEISFTITGKAPNYALPVVTFQNAEVTIKDAEILIPELDARQKATINVVDSIVHDAGGNSIVKSYYNGAINISGKSVVHTMQVTTMGYITISDTAKLNATWQTNVYGNGMITVEETATFATAALHLTGQDYSGRDNTDDNRVGKPAAIVVNGATLIVGKVYSDNGADYSYNSSKGINIGTVDGKSAVLDIKNGATVNIYMANGETANIGANGTVNVSSSVFNVACRAENGTVTLANNGVVNVDDSNLCIAEITNNGTINLTTANATLTTPEATLVVNSTVEGYKVVYADGKYIMEKVSYVAQIGDTKYTSLQEALNAAAAGTGNVTVSILDDIDLTNVDWNPVTVSAPGYPVVTVNGNNKTITGLNDMLFAGTWAGKSGLIINELTIKDSNIVNDENDSIGTVGVGAFIGYPQASATITLNNCHLVNSTVKGGHWTGGLIGMAGGYNGNDGPVFMNLTITGCSVTDSTITGKGSAGGIIGHGSCAAWTNVVIEDTTVSGNTITSTGTDTNKAGAVMGTIGAAGQSTTANGETKTGGATVSATVSNNIVTSNGTPITTIYGRQGTETGMLYVTGGTYDNYPIEENVTYAQPKEGYEIVQNTDNTYGVEKAAGKFEFYGSTVNLGSSLAMKFYIDDVNISGTDYYAVIDHYMETGVESKKVLFEQWSKDPNGYYIIQYSDIAAKQIGDTIEITIFDGNGIQVSVKRIDGIKAYAMRSLTNSKSELNTTLVDMLNYGAAAQLQFNYKTSELANADLTDAQKEFASVDMPELENGREKDEHVYGTTLTLESQILLKAYFSDLKAGMYVKVSFTDHYGNEISKRIEYENIGMNGSYYEVIVDSLVIADINQSVTITVHNSNGTVFSKLVDSMSGYLARQMPNGEDTSESGIYEAVAKFTASAYEFLH